MIPLYAADIRRLLPRRPVDSQKGKNGHVLLVAGSRGMAGAAVLSGLGALRSGAGLLTIGIVKEEHQVVTTTLPEAMTLPLPESKEGYLASKAYSLLMEHVRRRTITTLAIGPGLGVGKAQKALVLKLNKLNLSVVLDADALNNFSNKTWPKRGQFPAVITPHPGELARLIGKSVKEIQKDRNQSALTTAKTLGVICVLKGHQTVISDGKRTFINSTGNPAMATGGMGDVLTGVIAGLLAQGLSPLDAACAGVYLHGLAGDLAAVGDRGLLATEVANHIPIAIKMVLKTGARHQTKGL